MLLAVYGEPALAQTLSENRDADALAADMRLLAANPQDLIVLLDAGERTLRMGDTTAAAQLFARAARIDPNNARLKAGMGSLLVRAEKPGEALRRFQEAEARGLDVRKFAADRGLAYDLIGQPERAQRYYRLALAAGPDDEVTRRYALSLAIEGKRDPALKVLDGLLRKSDRAAWRDRAFILAMSGEVGGAQKIAETMMSPGLGAQLAPFFRRLPVMNQIDRAFAVTFGEVRPSPERLADAQLVPTLPQLGNDPYPPSPQLAAVTPVPKVTSEGDRKKSRKKKDKDRSDVMLAATTPPPPPLPPPPSSNLAAAGGPNAVVPPRYGGYTGPGVLTLASTTPVKVAPQSPYPKPSGVAGPGSSGRVSLTAMPAPAAGGFTPASTLLTRPPAVTGALTAVTPTGPTSIPAAKTVASPPQLAVRTVTPMRTPAPAPTSGLGTAPALAATSTFTPVPGFSTAPPAPAPAAATPPAMGGPDIAGTPSPTLAATTTGPPAPGITPSSTPIVGTPDTSPPVTPQAVLSLVSPSAPGGNNDADGAPLNPLPANVAGPSPAEAVVKRPTEDQILANIVANISVPGSELGVAPLPGRMNSPAAVTPPMMPVVASPPNPDTTELAAGKPQYWAQIAFGPRTSLTSQWSVFAARSRAVKAQSAWEVRYGANYRLLAGPFDDRGAAMAFVAEIRVDGVGASIWTNQPEDEVAMIIPGKGVTGLAKIPARSSKPAMLAGNPAPAKPQTGYGTRSATAYRYGPRSGKNGKGYAGGDAEPSGTIGKDPGGTGRYDKTAPPAAKGKRAGYTSKSAGVTGTGKYAAPTGGGKGTGYSGAGKYAAPTGMGKYGSTGTRKSAGYDGTGKNAGLNGTGKPASGKLTGKGGKGFTAPAGKTAASIGKGKAGLTADAKAPRGKLVVGKGASGKSAVVTSPVKTSVKGAGTTGTKSPTKPARTAKNGTTTAKPLTTAKSSKSGKTK